MLEWGRRSDLGIRIVEDDTVVATVRPGIFRERAEADIAGTGWTYAKQHGELLGTRDGSPEPALRAWRTRVLRQAWDVDAGGTTYRLRQQGFMRVEYVVSRDGAEIGSSGRAAFWSNRPTLDIDPGTPLEHRVFLLWVAYLLRRRAAAAASSGGAGGGAS